MGRHKRVLILALGGAAALVLALASAVSADTWPDKTDYSPGGVVTISGDNGNGAGYVPGNAVDVAVSGPNGWSGSCSSWVLDGGSWRCQLVLPSDPAIAAGSYAYTVTSADTLGNEIRETGSFTDHPYDLTLYIDTPTVAAGTSSITVRGSLTQTVTSTWFCNPHYVCGGWGSCHLEYDVCSSTSVYPVGGTVTVGQGVPGIGPSTSVSTNPGTGGYVLTLMNGAQQFVPTTPGIYAYWAAWLKTDWPPATAEAGALLTVEPSANTPPTVSLTGVAGGASYELGSVPAATCNVTDSEDGPSSFPATLSAVTGPLAAYGVGSQTADCSYTDAGGLTASASVTYSIIDTTDPVITLVSRTAPNVIGWNNTDVALTWSCTDSGTGPVATEVSTLVTGEGEWLAAEGVCADHAGNTASDTVFPIKIDKTPPVIVHSDIWPAPNAAGWNNTDVSVSFWAEDGLAGLASCWSTPATLSGEGVGLSVTGVCYDQADNKSETATVDGINIDKTPPTAKATVSPEPNGLGWNNTEVTISFTGDDALSGIDTCTADAVVDSEGAGQTRSGTCTDKAGNVSTAASATVNIDKTPPTAIATVSPAANAAGWNNTDVIVSFTGDDTLSGVALCDAGVVLTTEGAGQSASGGCTDRAGNPSAAAKASGISIDKTAPGVSWTPLSGSYAFGYVPAAPTCTATDVLSGAGGCTVSGYSTALGSHTLTATALDLAGNSKTATASYEVTAWTLQGFYNPVASDTTVLNLVRGGATVPLKFEVFAGATELVTTSSVAKFAAQSTPCGALADDPQAVVDFTTTGGTELRYDATAGQFIQNWKTPKTAGACYRVSVTTLDGSSLFAYFQTK